MEVNGIETSLIVASIYDNKDIERRIDSNDNSNKREKVFTQNIVMFM